MALLYLLALVLCELLPHVRSTRIHHGTSHQVQSSGHSEDADPIAVVFDEKDEKLLACEEGATEQRFIIQGKDKPFWDYYYAVAFIRTGSMHCKIYTPPPKPSSALRNLTTHALHEDVIGHIASFNDDVHCNACFLWGFDMTFLERCNAAGNANQFGRVNEEVEKEGGSCTPRVISSKERTLQTCMTSNKANQVARCSFQPESLNLDLIKESEGKIKENEDTIREHQELIKKKIQEHQEFIKNTQEFIKKKQETIKDLQEVVDIGKQNNVYLEQIFEGP